MDRDLHDFANPSPMTQTKTGSSANNKLLDTLQLLMQEQSGQAPDTP